MRSINMKSLGLGLALVALSVSAFAADEKAAPKEGSTEAVLAHHLGSLVKAMTEDKAAGIAEVVSDFTEESVILTIQGPVRGLEAITVFFTGLVEGMPTFMEGFELLREEIDGDVAYIVWKNNVVAMGTDTFIVKDGKIMVQTFAAHMVASTGEHEGHDH